MSNVAAMPHRGHHHGGDSFAQQVKAQLDLVELVGEYTQLKQNGKSHVGICPLPSHNEKTGSFHVYPDGGYKCFGCKAAGDALKFIEEVEGVEFVEALKIAAQRVGMPMPERNSELEQGQRLQWRVLQEVADWYQGSIRYHSERAMGYMRSRHITDESIKIHRLGYAPGKSDNLAPLIKRHGLKPFLELGLMRQSRDGHGHYAFFRDRLVIPVLNSSGSVIGFVGRAIERDAKAKYLTLNTPFFERSRAVYGAHTVKDPKGTIHLPEGPLDVILTAQQLGGQALAPLGTETSNEQLEQILAKCSTLRFLVDGDPAGRKAAVDFARLVLPYINRPIGIDFVKFPDDEDPGSWLHGKSSLDGLEAKPLDEVLICAARHMFDLSTWHGQSMAAEWLSETMPGPSAGPALEVLRHRLAVALSLPASSLQGTKAEGA
jgi:DNA primase